MKKLFVGILMVCMMVVGMVGCAGMQPNLSPEMKVEMEKPLICNGDEQCKLFWDRALFYVNTHSRYKIQTLSDNIIQTYNSTNADVWISYNIIKEPLGNNSYRIWIYVRCDNIFGCRPKKYVEILQFKKYVREGIK